MQPFTLNQLTRRVLASPGGGSLKNRTQWVLALLYIFQVSGTPKPEYTFVGRCQGLREPICKQSKAPYVHKLLSTLKQMKDPCAQGRMWSWLAGHPEGNNAGVDTPYTPRWNHSKRSVLGLGQSRGIRDTRYTVYMEGEAAPALSLLGPQKSPIPKKRMREKPGGMLQISVISYQ